MPHGGLELGEFGGGMGGLTRATGAHRYAGLRGRGSPAGGLPKVKPLVFMPVKVTQTPRKRRRARGRCQRCHRRQSAANRLVRGLGASPPPAALPPPPWRAPPTLPLPPLSPRLTRPPLMTSPPTRPPPRLRLPKETPRRCPSLLPIQRRRRIRRLRPTPLAAAAVEEGDDPAPADDGGHPGSADAADAVEAPDEFGQGELVDRGEGEEAEDEQAEEAAEARRRRRTAEDEAEADRGEGGQDAGSGGRHAPAARARRRSARRRRRRTRRSSPACAASARG